MKKYELVSSFEEYVDFFVKNVPMDETELQEAGFVHLQECCDDMKVKEGQYPSKKKLKAWLLNNTNKIVKPSSYPCICQYSVIVDYDRYGQVKFIHFDMIPLKKVKNFKNHFELKNIKV